MKRTALALSLILVLLISAVSETLFIETVMAKTITVPDDYPTIQAAMGKEATEANQLTKRYPASLFRQNEENSKGERNGKDDEYAEPNDERRRATLQGADGEGTSRRIRYAI